MRPFGFERLMAAAVIWGMPPAALAAQAPAAGTAVAVADSQFAAGQLERLLLGSNWRDLWLTPVRAPVLDIGTYAGGIEPYEVGGRQSWTLHFRNGEGRRYIFRSAEKNLHRVALPEHVRYTFIGNIIQDAISMMVPVVGVIMAPLHEAAGVLHSRAELVVMPDDPRLGEYRELFAGKLGQIEENPDELPDDEPGFAESTKIVRTSSFLERLDESNEHRLVSSEYLALRLVDFLVNDTDRGGDQWKFASYPDNGGELWRPVPRDADWALMRANGLLGFVVQRAYLKLASLDHDYATLSTLTFMTRDMDRRFLVDIPRPVWDSVVTALQTRITDDVLAEAIARLPDEYEPAVTSWTLDRLRSRRDQLHMIAAEYYEMVAREADIIASDEPERAIVERLEDGSTLVRLYALDLDDDEDPADGQAASEPFFTRRFVPAETREIRLFMRGGNDHVVVRGTSAGGILLRVIGGEDDDVLVDSATVAGGAGTVLYTAGGDNRIVAGPATHVDGRPFEHTAPGRPEDLYGYADGEEPGDDAAVDVEQKLSGERYRDWGRRSGFGMAVDHRPGVGVLAGGRYSVTGFGFRREPHRYSLDLTGLYAPERGTFGVEVAGDYRLENSPIGFELNAHASQFESFRFFGYGNDTPGDAANTRVQRDEIAVRPAVYWEIDGARLAVGPVVRYGRSDFGLGSPFDEVRPFGSGTFGQVGGWTRAEWEFGPVANAQPRGALLDIGAAAYPAMWDVTEAFGDAHAEAQAFVPVPGPGRPFLALRAGGKRVWGSFPAHEAAFIGGRHSLRGYATDRFAGDAAAWGGAELHVTLTRMELLVRGDLGVFGLADAGRVWLADVSPDGWHTALGGGLRFATLGSALSLAWAAGEEDRLYLLLGRPF
ncbi:hypothetical protein BH23GEM10_BH23GEM10_01150 [soil metagenome]